MKLTGYALALLVLMGLLLPRISLAISAGAFGANGEGGFLNGQAFDIGAGGTVFEVDGFVNIAGQDLNAGSFGTSSQLSVHALPAGFDFSFSSVLSDGDTDITLRYEFQNNTGAAILDLTFLSFLDAEIDEFVNDIINEVASSSGALAAGQGFEADEPGFVFGDIFDNLLLGTLDDTSAFPPEEDVAMALSFYVASLGVGDHFQVDVMISEDGDRIAPFAIAQTDNDPSSQTTVTYSGVARVVVSAPIPEPNAALVFSVGAVVVAGSLRRRRQS